MTTALAVAVLAAFVVLAAATTYRYARRDLLHPVVLVNGIMTYYVLIPAAYLLVTGMRAFPTRFDIARSTHTLTVTLAVLFGMYIVILAAVQYASWGRLHSRLPKSTLTDRIGDVNLGLLLVVGLIGFAVGMVAYGIFVWINGGIVRAFTVSPRTAFYTVPNTLRFKKLGMLGVFGGFATVLCALRPAIERDSDGGGGTGSISLLIAVAILAVVTALTLFVAVSTRARMVILVPLFILGVYLHTAGWLSQRAIVSAGVVVVAAAMSISLGEALFLGPRARVTLMGQLHAIVQVSRLALVMVLIESVPGEMAYQFGATLPQMFFFDLSGFPRYGNLVERIATGTDEQYRTSSAMLPGELWLNFGPVGIVIGGVLYGALLRWAYRLRAAASPFVRGIYPPLFVCILLLWPTNLTWAIPKLFVRVLAPVFVAAVAALVVQRQFPSIARTIDARTGTSE